MSTRTKQENNVQTIPSVRLLTAESESLAQAKEGEDSVYVYGQKEAFNTNIQGLIVKWEEIGGEGGSVGEGKEGV